MITGWLGTTSCCNCPTSESIILEAYCCPGRSKFKIRSTVSIEWVSLSPFPKVKKTLSQTIRRWGPSVFASCRSPCLPTTAQDKWFFLLLFSLLHLAWKTYWNLTWNTLGVISVNVIPRFLAHGIENNTHKGENGPELSINESTRYTRQSMGTKGKEFFCQINSI